MSRYIKKDGMYILEQTELDKDQRISEIEIALAEILGNKGGSI